MSGETLPPEVTSKEPPSSEVQPSGIRIVLPSLPPEATPGDPTPCLPPEATSEEPLSPELQPSKIRTVLPSFTLEKTPGDLTPALPQESTSKEPLSHEPRPSRTRAILPPSSPETTSSNERLSSDPLADLERHLDLYLAGLTEEERNKAMLAGKEAVESHTNQVNPVTSPDNQANLLISDEQNDVDAEIFLDEMDWNYDPPSPDRPIYVSSTKTMPSHLNLDMTPDTLPDDTMLDTISEAMMLDEASDEAVTSDELPDEIPETPSESSALSDEHNTQQTSVPNEFYIPTQKVATLESVNRIEHWAAFVKRQRHLRGEEPAHVAALPPWSSLDWHVMPDTAMSDVTSEHTGESSILQEPTNNLQKRREYSPIIFGYTEHPAVKRHRLLREEAARMATTQGSPGEQTVRVLTHDSPGLNGGNAHADQTSQPHNPDHESIIERILARGSGGELRKNDAEAPLAARSLPGEHIAPALTNASPGIDSHSAYPSNHDLQPATKRRRHSHPEATPTTNCNAFRGAAGRNVHSDHDEHPLVKRRRTILREASRTPTPLRSRDLLNRPTPPAPPHPNPLNDNDQKMQDGSNHQPLAAAPVPESSDTHHSEPLNPPCAVGKHGMLGRHQCVLAS